MGAASFFRPDNGERIVIRALEDIPLYSDRDGTQSKDVPVLKKGDYARYFSFTGVSAQFPKEDYAVRTWWYLWMIEPAYERVDKKPLPVVYMLANMIDNPHNVEILPANTPMKVKPMYDPTPYLKKTEVEEETDYSTTTPQDEYPTGTTGIPLVHDPDPTNPPFIDDNDNEYGTGGIETDPEPIDEPEPETVKPRNKLLSPVLGLMAGVIVLNMFVKK